MSFLKAVRNGKPVEASGSEQQWSQENDTGRAFGSLAERQIVRSCRLMGLIFLNLSHRLLLFLGFNAGHAAI